MGEIIVPGYLLAKMNISDADVCYAFKLSQIVRRRTAEPAQGKFGGLISGIGNVINDTISSAMHDTFMVRTNGGMVWVLSDNTTPFGAKIGDIVKNMDIISEEIKLTVAFTTGEVESAAFSLTKDSAKNAFFGSVKQMIADFGDVMFENMPDYFFTTVISKLSGGEKIYKFNPISTIGTLITYNESGITLLNEHKRYDYGNLLAYHLSEGYCEFLFWENSDITLVEMFADAPEKIADAELNVIRKGISGMADIGIVPCSDTAICAQNFLAVLGSGEFKIVAVDDKVYAIDNGKLYECGVFKVSDSIYVKSDSATKEYPCNSGITDALRLLPSGYDAIFLKIENPQPFMYKGELIDFVVTETGIKNNTVEFEYSKMQSCSYATDDFGCRISFTYNDEKIGLSTASSLGVYVSNLQEKVYVSCAISQYNINQLYDCYYKRCNKNFIASTFAEIFKTQKLIDVGFGADELIDAIRADESEVLRSAWQSMVGKFKNVEDIQSELIQKVTLLEIQRRKIQKIFDEWVLYYPHYMATAQVQWLKLLFGKNASAEMLNTEYWKCVAQYKRMLSGTNSYVQKNMNEIGSCINKISQALPDDAKRTDITGDLRINSNTTKAKLSAGTDVLMGVTAGVELANILVRGLTVANPLTLSLTAKMMVDSYTKDVTLRKNVKAYGLQALEWWQIFMQGMRIQIIELNNSVSEYNKQCLKRDTEMFKKMPDDIKGKVKAKLEGTLKEKITESIDDKFVEILPQFNMRISNIVDELDSNTEILNMTIDEFKNNLFK